MLTIRIKTTPRMSINIGIDGGHYSTASAQGVCLEGGEGIKRFDLVDLYRGSDNQWMCRKTGKDQTGRFVYCNVVNHD